jgi:hypothetical protein
VPKRVDVNQYQSAFKLYSDAEEALKTINAVSSAGLPNAGFDGFLGRAELEPIIRDLSNPNMTIVGRALMEYEAISGRIPSVANVQSQTRPATDTEIRFAGEVSAARGAVPNLYSLAMPFLSASRGALPMLTPQDIENRPIGYILQQVTSRLNLLKRPDGKVEDDDAQEFLALNQLSEKLNDLVSKYPAVRNSRGGDPNKLYLNPRWNGSDPADIFVTETQRGALNATPLSAMPGTDRNFLTTSSFLVNGLSQ